MWHITLQVDGYAAKPVAKTWRQRLPWAKKQQSEDKPQQQARMLWPGLCHLSPLSDLKQSMRTPLLLWFTQANAPFSRLLRLNKPESVWAVSGCLASAVLGAQMPAFSIALSSIIVIYYQPVQSDRCKQQGSAPAASGA